MPNDFKEFIQCLNAHDVRYLLVGGWAVGVYGYPRGTKDYGHSVNKMKYNAKTSEKSMVFKLYCKK